MLRARGNPIALNLLEHCYRCGARDGVAAEGTAEATGLRLVHDLGAASDARERQTARDPLRGQHDVGLHPELFDREHGAGARDARLHFVRDEDDTVGAAPLGECGQVALGWHDEATLALHRLDDEAGEVFCARGLLEVGNGAGRGLCAGEPVAQRVRVRSLVDVACAGP